MPLINKMKYEQLLSILFSSMVLFAPFLSILNLQTLDLRVFGILGLGACITYIMIALTIIPILKIEISRLRAAFLIVILLLVIMSKSLITLNSAYVLAKNIQYYLLALLFFLLGFYYIDSMKIKTSFITVLMISIFLLALIGIVHYHIFPQIILTDVQHYNDFHYNQDMMKAGVLRPVKISARESATIPSPVGYSHLLAFGIIIAYSCMRSHFKWVFIFVLLYAIVLSGSRSGLYIIFIYLIIMEVHSIFLSKKKLSISFIAVIILLFIFLTIIIYGKVFSRYDISSLYKTGLSLRLLIAKSAFEIITDSFTNFIIGPSLDLRPAAFFYGYGYVPVRDNSYLVVLCETGMIGLVLLMIFGKSIITKFKELNKLVLDNDYYYYVKAVKHCTIAFAVFALFNTIHHNLHQVIIIFILLGSIHNIGVNKYNYLKKSLNRSYHQENTSALL